MILHLGGEPDWHYVLTMGGAEWDNDELPQGLKISMSTPAQGYSVGNLATMTISGTVPYKLGTYVRNAPINLYEQILDEHGQETSRVLMFTWFLRSCMIYNESSITFSGIDAMAFTNNNYEIDVDDNTGETDTIGEQYTTAISTISALTGADIRIDRPNYSSISNLRIPRQSNWSIKSLMESTSKIDCGNYYTVCHPSYIELKKDYGSQITASTDREPLSLGVAQTPINMVMVYQTDMELPTPNTDEGETLADYGIFQKMIGSNQPTLATTMKIVTPLINPDFDMDNYSSSLSGKSFGTEFSCKKIKVTTYSGGYFYVPLAQIIFGQSYNTYFYICNADYYLTSEGVYASISGTAKSLSDYEYIGETEKSLKKKIEAEHNYHGSCFSITDGLTYSATDSTVVVNSG